MVKRKFGGGKDPFKSKLRITKESSSKKYILSGLGIFKVFNTKAEAERAKKRLKK